MPYRHFGNPLPASPYLHGFQWAALGNNQASLIYCSHLHHCSPYCSVSLRNRGRAGTALGINVSEGERTDATLLSPLSFFLYNIACTSLKAKEWGVLLESVRVRIPSGATLVICAMNCVPSGVAYGCSPSRRQSIEQ